MFSFSIFMKFSLVMVAGRFLTCIKWYKVNLSCETTSVLT